MRVVLDTNVFVAAGRSRNGSSFALLQALRANSFCLLASVPLFLEYEAVLKRPEHLLVGHRSAAMVDAFLDALVLGVEPVHLFYLWRPQLRDPADEMVLEAAATDGYFFNLSCEGKARAGVMQNLKPLVLVDWTASPAIRASW